jgi:hypothetical protein
VDRTTNCILSSGLEVPLDNDMTAFAVLSNVGLTNAHSVIGSAVTGAVAVDKY